MFSYHQLSALSEAFTSWISSYNNYIYSVGYATVRISVVWSLYAARVYISNNLFRGHQVDAVSELEMNMTMAEVEQVNGTKTGYGKLPALNSNIHEISGDTSAEGLDTVLVGHNLLHVPKFESDELKPRLKNKYPVVGHLLDFRPPISGTITEVQLQNRSLKDSEDDDMVYIHQGLYDEATRSEHTENQSQVNTLNTEEAPDLKHEGEHASGLEKMYEVDEEIVQETEDDNGLGNVSQNSKYEDSGSELAIERSGIEIPANNLNAQQQESVDLNIDQKFEDFKKYYDMRYKFRLRVYVRELTTIQEGNEEGLVETSKKLDKRTGPHLFLGLSQ